MYESYDTVVNKCYQPNEKVIILIIYGNWMQRTTLKVLFISSLLMYLAAIRHVRILEITSLRRTRYNRRSEFVTDKTYARLARTRR